MLQFGQSQSAMGKGGDSQWRKQREGNMELR